MAFTGTALLGQFKGLLLATPVRSREPGTVHVNQKGVVERDLYEERSLLCFQIVLDRQADQVYLRVQSGLSLLRWGCLAGELMVKVYSNAEEVELFVNGKSLWCEETQQ